MPTRAAHAPIPRDEVELQAVEEERRLAYGRLQALLAQPVGRVGIAIAGAGGQVVHANDDYLSIVGCSREDLQSGQLNWRALTCPEWLHTDERALSEVRERGVSDTYEKEYLRRDGSRVRVLLTGAMLPGDAGEVLVFVMDITNRRRTERLRVALGRVNEAIVRANDEKTLASDVCRILAEAGDYPFVWIAATDPSGRLVPAAWGGAQAAYLDEIDLDPDGLPGADPAARCIHEDRPVMSNDLAADLAAGLPAEPAVRRGLLASAAFPLRREGKVIGALTLYSGYREAFDPSVETLLESLCADVSYALSAIEHERRRVEAEQALRLQWSMALDLLGTFERPAVFDLLADRIYAVADGAIVVATEFIPRTRQIVVRSVRSSLEQNRLIAEILGRDPIGMSFEFQQSVRERWVPNRLSTVSGGVESLLAGQVPRSMCERLERELDLGDIFTMACAHDEDILGTIVIASGRKGRLRRRDTIQALVSQAALALRRIRAEDSRKETEERFRRLFESTSDGVVFLSIEGVILEVNDAYCAMSGYGRNELVGLHLERLEALETAEDIVAHRDKVKGGGHDRFDSRHRRKDGSIFDVDITAMYLEGEGGRLAMMVRDVTRRKQAEVALREEVSERRRAEEALRDANERLEEADRRKNEFLGMLSHELRNPLAPITSGLYILDHAPAGGEQAKRAKQVIARQVDHLSNLVNDLLDVTRITRSKIDLRKERMELNEVVRRTVEDGRWLFEGAGVDLRLALAPRPVFLLADRTRVVQIVGNLLQNSAKFTRPGGRTSVSVSVEPAHAALRVSDDGIGMAPETVAALFQPFMQADQALDRRKGGLGLGLALVKGLVELHGGAIEARSEGLGQGSEFIVRLPLEEAHGEEMAEARLPVSKKRRRVLIIEDNIDAAESLRDVLELGDHQVAVAYDGRQGLQKAREFLPEVVLCDIGLPGMDGYEVARAFRRADDLKTTFLVALSGYARPEDLQRALEAGFDLHLPKPPSLDRIEELLGRP